MFEIFCRHHNSIFYIKFVLMFLKRNIFFIINMFQQEGTVLISCTGKKASDFVGSRLRQFKKYINLEKNIRKSVFHFVSKIYNLKQQPFFM